MNAIVKAKDGFINLVSRLGGYADKASHSTYFTNIHNQAEIDAAYRTGWFRKIVETVPFDEAREWRTWQAETADQTTPIEGEEARHDIRLKVMRARILARKDGGSALYLGGLPGSPTEPLNINAVNRGALKFVTLFTRDQISPSERETDPLSPNYGMAKYYNLGTARIHPSRIIRFSGPDKGSFSEWDGWGDSLWAIVQMAVKNSDSAAAGVAALVQEAKLDIISVPGLMAKIATAEYESRLVTRFTMANSLKSINNMLLLDGGDAEGKGGESFEQKVLNFAGFPDIMDRFDTHMAGIAGIPVTRLLGRSPAGMNATGESDMRNYYDGVRAAQELELTPLLSPLDEVLIRSALGSRPSEIYYEWNPLYSLDEKEAATVEKTYAEALQIRVNTGTIDEAVLAKGEMNRMVESGRYPGLEAAIEESDDENGVKDPDEVAAEESARLERQVEIAEANRPTATDAKPRTLYVRRDVMNRSDFVKWAESQGFTDIVPDLHVTIAYSRAPVDWFTVGQSWSSKIDVAAGGPRQMEAVGPTGEYKALLIAVSELSWRHKEILDAGASWDWPDYQPHISIQIGGDVDLTKVEPYRGKIVLGPEIFEEVRAD